MYALGALDARLGASRAGEVCSAACGRRPPAHPPQAGATRPLFSSRRAKACAGGWALTTARIDRANGPGPSAASASSTHGFPTARLDRVTSAPTTTLCATGSPAHLNATCSPTSCASQRCRALWNTFDRCKQRRNPDTKCCMRSSARVTPIPASLGRRQERGGDSVASRRQDGCLPPALSNEEVAVWGQQRHPISRDAEDIVIVSGNTQGGPGWERPDQGNALTDTCGQGWRNAGLKVNPQLNTEVAHAAPRDQLLHDALEHLCRSWSEASPRQVCHAIWPGSGPLADLRDLSNLGGTNIADPRRRLLSALLTGLAANRATSDVICLFQTNLNTAPRCGACYFLFGAPWSFHSSNSWWNIAYCHPVVAPTLSDRRHQRSRRISALIGLRGWPDARTLCGALRWGGPDERHSARDK